MKRYCVRIVIPSIDGGPPLAQPVDGSLLECLRYAQLIDLHKNNEEGQCFDLLPPQGTDSKNWAEMNAERMRTFGYNAVSAPACV